MRSVKKPGFGTTQIMPYLIFWAISQLLSRADFIVMLQSSGFFVSKEWSILVSKMNE